MWALTWDTQRASPETKNWLAVVSLHQRVWGQSEGPRDVGAIPEHPGKIQEPNSSRLMSDLCCAVMCLVTRWCPTLCDPLDCSPPDSSVHGDSPGKNTGVDCHVLLQGIFPTQGSNPGLLHCRRFLSHLSTREALCQVYKACNIPCLAPPLIKVRHSHHGMVCHSPQEPPHCCCVNLPLSHILNPWP